MCLRAARTRLARARRPERATRSLVVSQRLEARPSIGRRRSTARRDATAPAARSVRRVRRALTAGAAGDGIVSSPLYALHLTPAPASAVPCRCAQPAAISVSPCRDSLRRPRRVGEPAGEGGRGGSVFVWCALSRSRWHGSQEARPRPCRASSIARWRQSRRPHDASHAPALGTWKNKKPLVLSVSCRAASSGQEPHPRPRNLSSRGPLSPPASPPPTVASKGRRRRAKEPASAGPGALIMEPFELGGPAQATAPSTVLVPSPSRTPATPNRGPADRGWVWRRW
jgi:hypothetical protein